MNSGPRDNQRRVIIADIHGNWPTLIDLLKATDAVSETTGSFNKNPDVWVCQIGDLLHCGHEVWEADAETLSLGAELIDCLLMGNHELPYATPLKLAFAGMHTGVRSGLHPKTAQLLRLLMLNHRFQAAVAVDGFLVTHAGFSPGFLASRSVPSKLREQLRSHSERAETMAAHLNDRFWQRLNNDTEDPVLEWIGKERGGKHPFGGIFWCDFDELNAEAKSHRNLWPQIVGHSPRSDSQPITDDSGQIWNIDLAGIDAGYCAALVKDPGDSEWHPVTVRRQRRPPSSLR